MTSSEDKEAATIALTTAVCASLAALLVEPGRDVGALDTLDALLRGLVADSERVEPRLVMDVLRERLPNRLRPRRGESRGLEFTAEPRRLEGALALPPMPTALPLLGVTVAAFFALAATLGLGMVTFMLTGGPSLRSSSSPLMKPSLGASSGMADANRLLLEPSPPARVWMSTPREPAEGDAGDDMRRAEPKMLLLSSSLPPRWRLGLSSDRLRMRLPLLSGLPVVTTSTRMGGWLVDLGRPFRTFLRGVGDQEPVASTFRKLFWLLKALLKRSFPMPVCPAASRGRCLVPVLATRSCWASRTAVSMGGPAPLRRLWRCGGVKLVRGLREPGEPLASVTEPVLGERPTTGVATECMVSARRVLWNALSVAATLIRRVRGDRFFFCRAADTVAMRWLALMAACLAAAMSCCVVCRLPQITASVRLSSRKAPSSTSTTK